MEEQRAKLNQMECNMKAPNIKKINLKHQTTSVDLKVTFLEEKKTTFIRFAPYRLGRTLPTNRSFVFLLYLLFNVCNAVLFVSQQLLSTRGIFVMKKKTHTKQQQ